MNQFQKSSIAEETHSKKESKNNSSNRVSSPQKVTGDYPTGGTVMDPQQPLIITNRIAWVKKRGLMEAHETLTGLIDFQHPLSYRNNNCLPQKKRIVGS